MEITLVRSWQALALRGLVGVLFGCVAFLWPNVTLVALVLLFGGYSLGDGVLATLAATRLGSHAHAWMLALEGLLGIAVGLVALLATQMAVARLAYLIAFWAICTGLVEIVAAVRLRRELPGEMVLGFAGLVSFLLGVQMLGWPRSEALVALLILGGYALSFGTLMLMLAFRLRRYASDARFFTTHSGVRRANDAQA
jgi:uncharacterized membrane protein HdeD (DUF308 family)